MGTDLGRVSEGASADADQALVSDQAASRLAPSGFDPSRKFTIKAWDVTVVGWGVGRIYAHSRGAALAKAWRSDAFGRITFGDFLKIASAHRAMFASEAFGEPIRVGGKLAFFVQMEGPYVAFAWPGEKHVLHSHPSDVNRGAIAMETQRAETENTGSVAKP